MACHLESAVCHLEKECYVMALRKESAVCCNVERESVVCYILKGKNVV